MSSPLNYQYAFIAILALIVLSFGIGRCTAPIPKPICRDVTRVDTLILRDTITQQKPVFTRVYVRDSIYVTVRDTLHHTDTVWLPREVKVYEDSLYRAEVSGYQPNLDCIDIYQQTKIITRDVTQVIKKKTRWGVGLQAGYGATLTDGRLRGSPYVGVGVSWNIIAW